MKYDSKIGGIHLCGMIKFININIVDERRCARTTTFDQTGDRFRHVQWFNAKQSTDDIYVVYNPINQQLTHRVDINLILTDKHTTRVMSPTVCLGAY